MSQGARDVGLPDLSGSRRLGDGFPRGGVLRLEHPVGADEETTNQHAVDQCDRQHDDDRGADEQRHLVMEVPAPDEVPGHRLDDVDDDARQRHAQSRDEHRDDQGAQVADSAWAFDTHLRGHPALPGRRRNEHQQARGRRQRDGGRLAPIQHPLRRWPPTPAP